MGEGSKEECWQLTWNFELCFGTNWFLVPRLTSREIKKKYLMETDYLNGSTTFCTEFCCFSKSNVTF